MFGSDDAVARLSEALDSLDEVAWSFGSAREAASVLRRLEAVGRRVGAVQLAALDEVDRSGVYVDDGHASAKVMVRHCGRLAPGAAAARASWGVAHLPTRRSEI